MNAVCFIKQLFIISLLLSSVFHMRRLKKMKNKAAFEPGLKCFDAQEKFKDLLINKALFGGEFLEKIFEFLLDINKKIEKINVPNIQGCIGGKILEMILKISKIKTSLKIPYVQVFL